MRHSGLCIVGGCWCAPNLPPQAVVLCDLEPISLGSNSQVGLPVRTYGASTEVRLLPTTWPAVRGTEFCWGLQVWFIVLPLSIPPSNLGGCRG